jgi:hypothetical protein
MPRSAVDTPRSTRAAIPRTSLQTLTGHDADTKSVSSVSLDDLKNAAKNGKPMTFSTPDDKDGKKKKLPFGMHGNHA